MKPFPTAGRAFYWCLKHAKGPCTVLYASAITDTVERFTWDGAR